MRFHVLTLFPDAFQDPLEYSMLARALERGLVSIDITDIRDYSHDAHHTADDYQFGGGHGMVLKPEPVFEATDAALSIYSEAERADIPIILFTPQGELLTQRLVEELSQAPAVAMICAHYAGIDNRVPEFLATREISLGDFVLTGGELPAMVLIDAMSRLVPGMIGSPENVAEDSISSGLLQHPLYTRPAEFQEMAAPDVLLSGHHANIERWRREQSLQRTLARLRVSEVSPQARRLAESVQRQIVEGMPRRWRPLQDLGVKRGPFYVLFLSSMPAVLVEDNRARACSTWLTPPLAASQSTRFPGTARRKRQGHRRVATWSCCRKAVLETCRSVTSKPAGDYQTGSFHVKKVA